MPLAIEGDPKNPILIDILTIFHRKYQFSFWFHHNAAASIHLGYFMQYKIVKSYDVPIREDKCIKRHILCIYMFDETY